MLMKASSRDVREFDQAYPVALRDETGRKRCVDGSRSRYQAPETLSLDRKANGNRTRQEFRLEVVLWQFTAA